MIRAELIKLATVRATLITLIVGVVGLLVTQVFSVPLLAAVAGGTITLPEPELQNQLAAFQPGTVDFQYAALNVLGGGSIGGSTGSIGVATVAILILGLSVATTDYRHGGIVAAALAQPRRGRLLAGKAVAAGIFGLATGALFAAISLVVLLATLLTNPGLEWAVAPVDAAATLVLGAVVVTLLTLVGLAVGVLARSQVTGLVVVISAMLLEPIVHGIASLVSGGTPLWTQFLPQALAHAALAPQGTSVLPWWLALGSLAAFAGVALVGASVALRRRDL